MGLFKKLFGKKGYTPKPTTAGKPVVATPSSTAPKPTTAPPASPKIDKPEESERAFIVTLKLSDDEYGTEEERDQIHQLSGQLEESIKSASAGEFDGDEFGGGTCNLYMYGPDADSLFVAVNPLLKASSLSKGARGVKRYGEASDPNAREEIVEY